MDSKTRQDIEYAHAVRAEAGLEPPTQVRAELNVCAFSQIFLIDLPLPCVGSSEKKSRATVKK